MVVLWQLYGDDDVPVKHFSKVCIPACITCTYSCVTIKYVSLHVGVFRRVCACWIYLQVEELQAVQLVEEIMGESGQLAAMHVQALQLLQTPEGSTFQTLQRVITQIELLQHPEVTEGSSLDPRDVVAVQPKHLQGMRRK